MYLTDHACGALHFANIEEKLGKGNADENSSRSGEVMKVLIRKRLTSSKVVTAYCTGINSTLDLTFITSTYIYYMTTGYLHEHNLKLSDLKVFPNHHRLKICLLSYSHAPNKRHGSKIVDMVRKSRGC